jgi:hypothetical protein
MLMNDLTAVIRIFPAHEFKLRRLYASEAEFKTLCEDYAVAIEALDRWSNDRVRARQYRQLVDELEDEIFEFVEGRHPHQVGKGSGR